MSTETTEATRAPAVVQAEPLTYEQHHTDRSYFQDLWNQHRSWGARERLERHAAEMEVRAPNQVPGTGGYFTPPAYINQYFATFPRSGRVLASQVPSFPLPPKAQSFTVNRLTTGTSEGTQADNSAGSETDITDTNATSRVVTIDGQVDVPLQLLEQSPPGAYLDWAMMKDLTDAYDSALEFQLLFGTGAGGANLNTDVQLLGLVNVSGINKQTFTTGTPFYSSSATAANNLNTYIGQAGAQVGDNRKLPPQAIFMTTSRWMWIAASIDNQNRPIVPPDVHPPQQDGVIAAAVSTLAGFPVYVDDSIPNTLQSSAGAITSTAGGLQDVVVFCRPSDLILLESTPQTMVTREPLSGTLGARIILRNAVAALTNRYPSGIATIAGTGMVVQTGY